MKLAITLISLGSIFLGNGILLAQEPAIKQDSSTSTAKPYIINKDEYRQQYLDKRQAVLNGPKLQNIPVDYMGASYKGFKLQVSPSLVNYQGNEPIILRAVVKNASKRQLKFVGYIGYPTSGHPLSCTFVILITDSQGQSIQDKYFEAGEEHYCPAMVPPATVSLGAGEMESFEVTLNDLYNLKKGDTYTVVFIYPTIDENQPSSSQAPYGLVSNKVFINIP
ncbi:hypothetical protein [Gloeobacter kilaueensis]|uniref:Uncharacterized protein n=1 Tax=Gloeobacter kilaueensis (strain ATCC BAA-2537 / CCAP 1431/1 / ULC 316 / JS1) TaxID=1183438 RepID=U5QQP5_GLOK1|nr:hypothetical protein [Gloeobacter kilaueensis]AGY60010.1 hypothetical protein GKIL_3764 [Gloeobacter kilaueensis JS1]